MQLAILQDAVLEEAQIEKFSDSCSSPATF